MPANDLDRLWDANDVASYLHVSRSWVYQRVEAGDLPHLRFGGHLRFERDAILAYARGGRTARTNVVEMKRR